MNNIPVFMSQGGTATLILREIPYKQTAYVLLQTVIPENLPQMVAECAAFCRECGAKQCALSSRDDAISLGPEPDYAIYQMQAEKAALPAFVSPFTLTPLAPDNEDLYISLYNRCFREVTNAVTYDRSHIQRIYREQQQAFLALLDGVPCGMGELHGNELAAVGLLPEYRGQGRELALALLEKCPGPELTLTVASDNPRAMALYEKLGFRISGTESKWYHC